MRLKLAFTLLAALFAARPALPAGPEPRRIVSTAPSITETLFALGLGNRIVGVTTYCVHPLEAKRIPKIGTFLQPNLETILSLRPDLVVTIRNPVRLRERLSALGLRSAEVDQEDVGSVLTSIQTLGEITGARAAAARLESDLRSSIEEVRRRAQARPPKTAAFIVGRNPGSLEGLVAAGKGSYLNELLEIAGGRNVFGGAATPYPRISIEQLLACDPEVLLDMADMANPAGLSREDRKRSQALWARYPSLQAVRIGKVITVTNDAFVVPGPRIKEAVKELYILLHGEGSR